MCQNAFCDRASLHYFSLHYQVLADEREKQKLHQSSVAPHYSATRYKTLFAPLTFEGSCNRDLFETWLANCLIPQLKPGDIIIIDHARFHQGAMIQELVEAAGCEIWYLPSYSSKLMRSKRRLRQQLSAISYQPKNPLSSL